MRGLCWNWASSTCLASVSCLQHMFLMLSSEMLSKSCPWNREDTWDSIPYIWNEENNIRKKSIAISKHVRSVFFPSLLYPSLKGKKVFDRKKTFRSCAVLSWRQRWCSCLLFPLLNQRAKAGQTWNRTQLALVCVCYSSEETVSLARQTSLRIPEVKTPDGEIWLWKCTLQESRFLLVS